MPDRSDLAAQVAEDPEFESALSAIADVDADSDDWTFDDVPVDTGTFGRLVSRGVVEDADGGGYRLADPDAVRAALEGAADARDGGSAATDPGRSVELSDFGLGRTPGWLPAVGAALAVVALVVWTRAYIYPDVFHGGDVVLTANDPYAYRFYLERTLAASNGPLDLGALADLPTGEPLFLASLWLAASLLGGGQVAASEVLAWYPVAAALAVCGLVYVLGARVLGDRRVGLAAALSLALVPGFAFRTSLGFGDHHAFDYLWLTATVTVFAWLVTLEDPLGRRARRGAGLLGVCLAGQTLAWEGSPLLLLPVAGYLAVVVPLDVRADRPPLRANAPVLLGSGIAAALALGAHVALGWQDLSVAVVPALLCVGGVGLAAVGELVRRRDLSARALVATEVGGPALGLVVAGVVVPGLARQLLGGVAFLLFRSNVAEKEPSFALDQALGLELLGGALVLGLPVLAWGAWWASRGDRRWLVVSGYGAWLCFLAALQLRFAGHFAPLLALCSGVAVVWLLARYDLTAAPASVRRARRAAGSGDETDRADGDADDGRGERWRIDRDALTVRSGLAVVLVVALVVGASGLYLPGEVEGGLVDDETYHTAVWMDDYATERDWEYPENYVFSRWGVNRVYNYFVNGVSQNYSRAQRNYTSFVYNGSSAAWYERLRNDTGFVVIEPLPRRPGTIQQHLYVTYGSRWNESGYDAVAHYRAVYTSRSGRKKVFTLVPGATISGTAPVNTTVEARTTVEIPNESVLYRQQTTVGSDGDYRLVVPYPGEYEMTVGNETRDVSVPEAAVRNGERIRTQG
ncbi:MAG: STT3 domain-containing protein [Halosimplex sp.]